MLFNDPTPVNVAFHASVLWTWLASFRQLCASLCHTESITRVLGIIQNTLWWRRHVEKMCPEGVYGGKESLNDIVYILKLFRDVSNLPLDINLTQRREQIEHLETQLK